MEPRQQVDGTRDDTQFNAPETRNEGFASSIQKCAALSRRAMTSWVSYAVVKENRPSLRVNSLIMTFPAATPPDPEI